MTVHVVRDGAVALVRLDGPSLSLAVKTSLLACLRDVACDASVRAVILTGSGRVFSLGQDLRELDALIRVDPARAADTVEKHYNPITLLLSTMDKPVIAAVNGTCVGAGLGFALACDLQVWSRSATLSTAFVKVGLTCDSGLSATLVQAVGAARARELVLLSEPFTPAEATAWGFAGRVVAPEEVLPTALALATRLAAGPAKALVASKRLLSAAAAGRPLSETLKAEAEEQSLLGETPDHAAGVAAFLARKAPEFSG